MAEDYTPQQVVVTIRTADEWKALNERAFLQWRDTPALQLSAEVEKMLAQFAKPKAEPRAVNGTRRGPRAQAA